jgi:hypothetical protein
VVGRPSIGEGRTPGITFFSDTLGGGELAPGEETTTFLFRNDMPWILILLALMECVTQSHFSFALRFHGFWTTPLFFGRLFIRAW